MIVTAESEIREMINKRKRRVIKFIALGAIVTSAVSLNVKAYYSDFYGNADFSWSNVGGPNKKDDYSTSSVVDWRWGSSNGYKMWFKLTDSNNVSYGKVLVNRPGNGGVGFKTYADHGKYYWVNASREHFLNPTRTVSGVFEP